MSSKKIIVALDGSNLTKIKKIVNYLSEKIIDLNSENKKIIESHPPDTIFVYSSRSAQSFIEITKNHFLYPLIDFVLGASFWIHK